MMGHGYGMGPWMMRGYGMMGPGYGYCYGRWYGPHHEQHRKPMQEKKSK